MTRADIARAMLDAGHPEDFVARALTLAETSAGRLATALGVPVDALRAAADAEIERRASAPSAEVGP